MIAGIVRAFGASLSARTPTERVAAAVGIERAAARLTSKRIELKEGPVFYLDGGEGPVVVLLHGFGANKDNWNRLARHLVKSHRVIVPDLPGFGESFKRPELTYGIDDQVRRLHELVAALGLETFALGGNSMGGYIAGVYGAMYPERAAELWLLDPLGVQRAPASPMFQAVIAGARAVVLAGSQEQYRELLDAVFMKQPFAPKFVLEVLAQQAIADFSLHSEIFSQIHRFGDGAVTFERPLEDALSDYKGRVLVIWGSGDAILHPGGAEVLREALSDDVDVQILDGVGHLPMMEAPRRTAKAILAFARRAPHITPFMNRA